MFEPKWLSFYLFSLAAFVQFGLFVVEFWVLARKNSSAYPAIFKFFGLIDADLVGNKNFIVLSAFNHFFISIVLLVGLRYVLKLQPFIAGPISGLGALFTLVISVVYVVQSKKYWKVALIQFVPMLLGMIFLISHILPAIRASQQ